jgi:metallo-beta-lactamase family protein
MSNVSEAEEIKSGPIQNSSKVTGKITFAGGAITPTGSNFLFEVGGRRFLIDCGLYQGTREAEMQNREDFKYDVKSIDALFITHGHLDHVGLIPKLFHDGYDGPIYSTPPTKDIGELIMLDSLSLLKNEAAEKGYTEIYEEKDVIRAVHNWHTVNYHEVLPVDTDAGILKIRLLDAGHIIGSSMIEFEINGKKLVFTGDLGNTPSPLMRDTEKLVDTNYLVMESVYGDRNHEGIDTRVNFLKEIILKTTKRGGTLMIPAFSVERTQEILYHINNFVEAGEIPKCNIYLDSPLGINVTKVYKKYERDYMNTEANDIIKSGDDIFNFKGLIQTPEKEESMKINDDHGPKIIVAGSGMSNGGRIQHHEERYLSDPKSTLLIVGYQAVGTLGRTIQEGAKKVMVRGREINVKAEIQTISGFSAHKDSNNLVEFAGAVAKTLRKVFVVLGEPRSSMFLAQRINEYYDIPVQLPKLGETVEISF